MTWWIWSIALAISVVRSNDVFIAIAVIGGVALIVKRLAQDAPWAHSFWWALKLGAVIIVARSIIGVLIGTPIPGTKILTLPILPLPSWMAGIRVGGVVTLERLSSTIHEGIIIATIIALFGAATSLTSPHRLLRVTPVFFYEFGVALVIATSVLPQFVISAGRIRQAQQLRGNDKPSWRSIAIPLLEDSLARSLDLAAAMDARGYGYSRKRSRYRATKWQLKDSAVVLSALATLPIFALVAM